MVARQCIDDGYPVGKVLKNLWLVRSSYCFSPAVAAGKGRTYSTHSLTGIGRYVNNELVLEQIQQILSRGVCGLWLCEDIP